MHQELSLCPQSGSCYQRFNPLRTRYLEHKSLLYATNTIYCIWPKTFSLITSFPGCENHVALAITQKGAADADIERNSWMFGRGTLERCKADLLCSLASVLGTWLCGSGLTAGLGL